MDYTQALKFTCPSGGRHLSDCHVPTTSARGVPRATADDELQFRSRKLCNTDSPYLERPDRACGRSIAGILSNCDSSATITSQVPSRLVRNGRNTAKSCKVRRFLPCRAKW